MVRRVRKVWAGAEDKRLIEHFNKNMTYEELARQHKTTVAAIRSRLYVLRKNRLIGKRR